jgi:hypothetical protein
VIWHDDNWLLRARSESTGVPVLVTLHPRAHFDLSDLTDELAGELGVRVVHVARAIELLSHIARARVDKWGDGGDHLHVFSTVDLLDFRRYEVRVLPCGMTYCLRYRSMCETPTFKRW